MSDADRPQQAERARVDEEQLAGGRWDTFEGCEDPSCSRLLGAVAAGAAGRLGESLAIVAANLAFALEALEALAPVRAGGLAAGLAADELGRALGDAKAATAAAWRVARHLATVGDVAANPVRATDVRRAVEAARAVLGPELEARARFDVGLLPAVAVSEGALARAIVALLVESAEASPGPANAVALRIAGRPSERGGVLLEIIGGSPPSGTDATIGIAALRRAVPDGEVSVEGGEQPRGRTVRAWLPPAR